MVVFDERELLLQSLEARRRRRSQRQKYGLCILVVAALFLNPVARTNRTSGSNRALFMTEEQLGPSILSLTVPGPRDRFHTSTGRNPRMPFEYGPRKLSALGRETQ